MKLERKMKMKVKGDSDIPFFLSSSLLTRAA